MIHSVVFSRFFALLGALCLVIATFWAVGWTLGAIEAISLSILVGTSVDYTVHLTEGYIMATKIADFDGLTNRVRYIMNFLLIWKC